MGGQLEGLTVAPAQQVMGATIETESFIGKEDRLDAAAAAAARGGVLPDEILFDDPSGKYELRFRGAFPAVQARVSYEDRVVAEGGSMLTASEDVDVFPSLGGGGVTQACCRSCCLDETFFFSTYKGKTPGGPASNVLLAPSLPGEIALLTVDETRKWRIGRGGFFAADDTVDLKVVRQTIAQGCCAGEGLFVMKARGHGRLLVNSYGGLVLYRLQDGDERVVENGQLVAWSANTPYKIVWTSRRGVVASCLSGQRLACKFEAPTDGSPGYVLASTHSVERLAAEMVPFLPKGAPDSNTTGGGGDNGGGGF